jgi:hypothetical protein
MAGELEGQAASTANGIAAEHLPNGALENGDAKHDNGYKRLTLAEKKKLKKKQRKANRKAER